MIKESVVRTGGNEKQGRKSRTLCLKLFHLIWTPFEDARCEVGTYSDDSGLSSGVAEGEPEGGLEDVGEEGFVGVSVLGLRVEGAVGVEEGAVGEEEGALGVVEVPLFVQLKAMEAPA